MSVTVCGRRSVGVHASRLSRVVGRALPRARSCETPDVRSPDLGQVTWTACGLCRVWVCGAACVRGRLCRDCGVWSVLRGPCGA